jgi:cell wall-associated NlpC family hydrolase
LSSRLSRLLPAFAFAATILFLAIGIAPAALIGGRVESAAAAPAEPPDSVTARPPDARPPEPKPKPPKPPKPTVGERAAKIALRAVGVPYRWGGTSPSGGFDCSGLVYWAYGRLGIEVPHSSYALYGQGQAVARSRMKPGDVLFFSGLGHVGLYLGGGRMVHAPQTGRLVEVVTLTGSHYGSRLVGARRVVTA